MERLFDTNGYACGALNVCAASTDERWIDVHRGEDLMTALCLDDLKPSSDVLRTKNGHAVHVRLVEPRDREVLQSYFRSLSDRSRYNRFLTGLSELPAPELDRFIHIGEDHRFTVVATMVVDGFETIVGEARYAFDADALSVEFGLSIGDRWQDLGIGKALMKNLECRAASLGAECIFGDTLRSNKSMIGLARRSGYADCRELRRLETGALQEESTRRTARCFASHVSANHCC
jgi:RimJ/RimL family protein N-acetyltransferase